MACTTRTEIKLVVNVWFDESLIDPLCEMHSNAGLIQAIPMSTSCITSLKEDFDFNANYSVVCPICDDFQYSIRYSIPRNVLIDASDCSITGTVSMCMNVYICVHVHVRYF